MVTAAERHRRGPRRRVAAGVASIAVVAGGDRRQVSVAAGLRRSAASATARAATPRRAVVLVHDGARPLVSPGLVEAVAAATAEHGAAIPVLPVAETLKRVDDDGRRRDRRPRRAWRRPRRRRASAPACSARRSSASRPTAPRVHRRGRASSRPVASPSMSSPATRESQGDRCPPTSTAVDAWRSAATARRARVGFGHDSHPFGPGEPLALGGIAIAGAPRLHGHSDGDVALHAVADALLGAAGLGDLGRLFPADPSTPRGIASGELLAEVVARLAAAGWRPASIDLTIVAARPRLGAHLDGDARRDRRAARARAGARQRQGLDRQPRRVATAPAAAISARRSRRRRRHGGGVVTLRLHDTLSGETRPLEPLEPRPRPDLQLRADRLRPGPHRQLPLVPVRRPARALPALARAARHAGS